LFVSSRLVRLRNEFSLRHGRPRQVVYVTPESSIEEVVHALAKHQVHRLYICDSQSTTQTKQEKDDEECYWFSC
jgi:hypothetical protein